MKKLLVFFAFLLSTSIQAQELNCEIFINSDRIAGTNKQRFETLKTSLTEFMNSTVWTNISYDTEERIDVNISLILMQDLGSNQFTASLEIQSRRPVYNTDYYSPTYNFKDTKFTFSYTENQPIIYNEQNFTSNLVSVMSFYAYLMIGIDQDSFKEMGGTESFQKARQIVEFTQNKGYTGWDASSNRSNRYWIIENLLSDVYSDARKASYTYHRKGLDVMSTNSIEGKQEIIEALSLLERVARNKPNSTIVQNFMDAKQDEIVDIFSAGPRVNTAKIKETLNTLSPTNLSKWAQIK